MKNITPFMIELHKDLKEKREIADVTANQYIRTLYSLIIFLIKIGAS